jgi:hypothetical protein
VLPEVSELDELNNSETDVNVSFQDNITNSFASFDAMKINVCD